MAIWHAPPVSITGPNLGLTTRAVLSWAFAALFLAETILFLAVHTHDTKFVPATPRSSQPASQLAQPQATHLAQPQANQLAQPPQATQRPKPSPLHPVSTRR
jgi:hypothetical protein